MNAKRIAPDDQPMREIRPVRMSYAALFPACKNDCGDISDTKDGLCNRCSYEAEYRQRQELQRQARAAGR